jgi:hypothetical protein
MPQLLHPSFLRLGRRTAAVLLVLLGAAVVLVTGLARPADASDPYVAGSDATRTVRLGGTAAAAAASRAIGHENALGLGAAISQRTVDRVVDRRGHRTYDEVTDLDARGRPVAVIRYGLDGRLLAATQLGWQPGTGRALVNGSAAVRAADRLARSVGIAPVGRGVAQSRGANGWSVRWDRVDGGIPVPGDGLRLQLWPDGSFHGLVLSEHPLAARPAATIPAATAETTVGGLLDGWIPAAARRDARIAGAALAWVAPNDTFEPARPDAPAEVRRLAWVVSVRSSGALAGTLRGLEVSIDAVDGTLLGGDVLR